MRFMPAALPLLLNVLFCNLAATPVHASDYLPVALRVEYVENPLGLDVDHPRFFWQIRDSRRGSEQTAYRIQVATAQEQLTLSSNSPDIANSSSTSTSANSSAKTVWDTGRVETSQTIHIEYAGTPLLPCTRYYWKVTSWDKQGSPADSGDVAYFETGMLRNSQWNASPSTR